jgi:hypothetical protein
MIPRGILLVKCYIDIFMRLRSQCTYNHQQAFLALGSQLILSYFSGAIVITASLLGLSFALLLLVVSKGKCMISFNLPP